MKKIASVLGIFIVISFVLMFSSCVGNSQEPKEPTTADELYELIEEKMDAQESYKIKENTSAVFYTSGYEININIEAEGIYDSLNSDDYYFYYDSELIMDVPEFSKQVCAYSVKSYQNGTYFSSYKEEDEEQKIYTLMTKDEFLEYKEGNVEMDLDVYSSTTRTFEKNDNGWVFMASGFTKKSINSFIKSIGFEEEFVGGDPIDFEIKFEVSNDFLVKTATFTFIFEEKAKDMPSFTLVNEYSSFGNVERIPLEKDGYTEMDVRVLDNIEESLNEIKKSTDFKFITKKTIDINVLDTVQTTTEQATISYGEDRNGYFYSIESKINGVEYKIDYENGVETVKVGDDTSRSQMTDDEARTTVKYYLDPASFSKTNVKNLSKNDDGSYTITFLTVNASRYREDYYNPLGGVYSGATEELVVTLQNGKLTKMTFISESYGFIKRSGITYDIEIKEEFNIYF